MIPARQITSPNAVFKQYISADHEFIFFAIKAQAAGCIPLYFPEQSLQKTVLHGVTSSPQTLAADWISILDDTSKRDEIRKDLANEPFVDWAQSTSYLLDCAEYISFDRAEPK